MFCLLAVRSFCTELSLYCRLDHINVATKAVMPRLYFLRAVPLSAAARHSPSALGVCRRAPPDACWHRPVSSWFAAEGTQGVSACSSSTGRETNFGKICSASAWGTHRVGGDGQALLDEGLERGLQDQVLVRDGLLGDLLSGDGLQRLRRLMGNQLQAGP